MRDGDYGELHKRLLEFYSPDEAHAWMRSEQKLLEGRRPVDCQHSEVSRLIAQLEDGAYI